MSSKSSISSGSSSNGNSCEIVAVEITAVVAVVERAMLVAAHNTHNTS